jgi:hypothetical protein
LFLVCTGGDDNALGFSLVLDAHNDDGKLVTIDSMAILNAHAAAITAVSLFAKDSTIFAVTSGADQRVKTWTIALRSECRAIKDLTVKRTGTWFTPVADVAACSNFPRASSSPGHSVLLCGAGREIWQIP